VLLNAGGGLLSGAAAYARGAPSAGVGHDRRTGMTWTPSLRATEAGKGQAAPGRDRWPLTAASLLVKEVAE